MTSAGPNMVEDGSKGQGGTKTRRYCLYLSTSLFGKSRDTGPPLRLSCGRCGSSSVHHLHRLQRRVDVLGAVISSRAGLLCYLIVHWSTSNSMTTPSTPRRASVYHPRPSSPSPSTSGFSFIGEDEASSDNDHLYWEYSRSPYKSIGSFGRRAIHSSPALTSHFHSSSSSPFISGSDAPSNNSFKSLLPRLWDVLIASPTKTILSPSRPALSGSGRHAKFVSYSTTSFGRSKGKRMYRDQDYYNDSINFLDLPPLDGDEGELIDVDDEACFIAVEHPWGAINASRARVVTGIGVSFQKIPRLPFLICYEHQTFSRFSPLNFPCKFCQCLHLSLHVFHQRRYKTTIRPTRMGCTRSSHV